jgi:hypothetical protein
MSDQDKVSAGIQGGSNCFLDNLNVIEVRFIDNLLYRA